MANKNANLYLVKMHSVDLPATVSAQELSDVIKKTVVPGFRDCARLEAEHKMLAGGAFTGGKGLAFIIEASSHQEVNDMITRSPFWGLMKTEIIPLDRFQDRADAEARLESHVKELAGVR